MKRTVLHMDVQNVNKKTTPNKRTDETNDLFFNNKKPI